MVPLPIAPAASVPPSPAAAEVDPTMRGGRATDKARGTGMTNGLDRLSCRLCPRLLRCHRHQLRRKWSQQRVAQPTDRLAERVGPNP